MIADLREKCKAKLGGIPRDVLVLAVLVLVALASFGLGYVTGEGTAAQRAVQTGITPDVATSTDGLVVASRNGSKYYLPWCSGADRISEANRVWFTSETQAKTQGYSPASNCDGL